MKKNYPPAIGKAHDTWHIHLVPSGFLGLAAAQQSLFWCNHIQQLYNRGISQRVEQRDYKTAVTNLLPGMHIQAEPTSKYRRWAMGDMVVGNDRAVLEYVHATDLPVGSYGFLHRLYR